MTYILDKLDKLDKLVNDISLNNLTDLTDLIQTLDITAYHDCVRSAKTNTSNIEKRIERAYKTILISTLRPNIMLSDIGKRFKTLYINNKLNFCNDDHDINYHYDMTDKSNLDVMVSITKHDFLFSMYETYKTNEDIIKQFMTDLPRELVYINGIQYTDIGDLLLELSKYNYGIQIGERQTNLIMLVFLLICQSTFYTSFYHMFKKISMMKNKIDDIVMNNMLMYGPNKNISKLPNIKNYHLLDTSNKNKLSFVINENNMCCTCAATYRIVDTTYDSPDLVTYVNTEFIFDMNAEYCLILYESSDILPN